MQVTIRHRQEPGRFGGRYANYFIDCQVEFSEEEKAIISARGLGRQYSISVPSAIPYYAGIMEDSWPSVVVRLTSYLAIFLGIVLIVIGASTSLGAGLGFIVTIAGVGLWIYLKAAEKRSDAAFKEQSWRLDHFLQKSVFTVYAATPDKARDRDTLIREELARLKDAIMRNVEVKQTERFEL